MAVGDDVGEGMQCSDHPYGNNLGGICALCLQEKLGKLVSSSNGSTPFPSHLSSPSFRSDNGSMGPSASSSGPTRTAGDGGRTRVPFLSATATRKKNSSGGGGVRKVTAASPSVTITANNVVGLKRSKSGAPRPMGGAISDTAATDSLSKKSFWSFLYLSSSSSSSSTAAASSSGNKRRSASSGTCGDDGSRDLKPQQQQQETLDAPPQSSTGKVQTKTNANVTRKDDQEAAADNPGGSQASSSSLGRKVARSRSVGCGSRSFSGDFLERISTGFGDCTLRRAESHRESNSHSKHSSKMALRRRDSGEQRIKERVKCGGIFGGFGMISSSSTYWLSAAAGGDDFDTTSNRFGSSMARISSAAIVRGGGGRSSSWGWAFASPMRAFRPTTFSSSASSKPCATTTNAISSINAFSAIGNGNGKIINGGSGSTGKVGANPSLLAVGG